jgi:glycosyltransferase involved in cell wall biosynthesis
MNAAARQVTAVRPMRVAIVAHFAWGAISGGRSGHMGGVERQTSMMARWLAARGHEVTLITWDEGQPDDSVIDGVRVVKLCRQDAGLPGVRFFVPRWSSLERALAAADADVYYHNCAEYVTGQVAWWCRRHRRAFVYSVASDMDVVAELPELTKGYERVLYRYGLRRADRIVVQTESQREHLRTNFGHDSVVLPMPADAPDFASRPVRSAPDAARRVVLWVGRIAPVKRLELLLEVAGRLPAVSFKVAGMPYAGEAYSEDMLRRARATPNVEVLGAVPRERMDELYREASLLCCTSHMEGFPNTFIEAWSWGVPVISTVDPGGVIQRESLGMHATTAESLARGIESLSGDANSWLAMSRNAREYFGIHHQLDAALGRFENLFHGLAESRR